MARTEQGPIKIKMTGISPYLMHNVRLANPIDKYSKLMKQISSKRDKTDEDHAELSRLEFFGGLYYSEASGGPYIPSRQLEACIMAAAKTRKQGKTVARGLVILNDEIPLLYPGPRTPEELFDSGEFTQIGGGVCRGCFVDVRSVRVQNARVMRTRPIFREWSAVAELLVDEKVMNRSTVSELLEIAGSIIGIGELRPRYGRFDVQVTA